MGVGATELVGASITETVPSPPLGTYTNGPCCARAAPGPSAASAPVPTSSAARMPLSHAAQSVTCVGGANTRARMLCFATHAVHKEYLCEHIPCAPRD